VYDGILGDESTPLVGVIVSVYGANNAYPDLGAFIRSTTTDSAGFYALTVSDADGAFEFYHILQTDAAGYFSVGATSVDGTVRENNWIEYVVPLAGKTLTGNKFWDQTVTVPTPTPVPLLSGRVYEGEIGDESRPLPEVSVVLYCANAAPPVLGRVIDSAVTDETGWYGVQIVDACEFYNIVETDRSGYVSVGATSVSGDVVTPNWITYTPPFAHKTLTGNKFWDQQVPTPAPTATRTPRRAHQRRSRVRRPPSLTRQRPRAP
jgi:hypothetical protein